MDTDYFFARDEAGTRCRISRVRTTQATSGGDAAAQATRYVMEDGSALRRIDNDTFQVIATGAYVSVQRD